MTCCGRKKGRYLDLISGSTLQTNESLSMGVALLDVLMELQLSEEFGVFPALRSSSGVLGSYFKHVNCFWCSPPCEIKRARAAEPPRSRPCLRNGGDSQENRVFHPCCPGTSRRTASPRPPAARVPLPVSPCPCPPARRGPR